MFNPKTVPVRGIGKRLGGHYFRRVRTGNERRMNQRIDGDEPPARAARVGHNIPTNWDDIDICRQRTWKAQGRRARSWDR